MHVGCSVVLKGCSPGSANDVCTCRRAATFQLVRGISLCSRCSYNVQGRLYFVVPVNFGEMPQERKLKLNLLIGPACEE